MSRFTPQSAAGYLSAVVSVALATWARLLLDPLLGTQFPFVTVFFAILVTAWYGGFRPALLAVALGAAVSNYFLMLPRGDFALTATSDRAGLVLYVLTGIGIALLAGSMHSARKRAESTSDSLLRKDIIERRSADEALHYQERLLRIVTGSARVGLVVVDNDYRYLFANNAYADMFGLRSGEIVGRRVPDVLSVLWSEIQPRLDRALDGEQPAYDLSLPALPGMPGARHFSVVYESQPGEAGERTAVVVVIDVTEQRNVEEALRESEARVRVAQQVAGIGTFEWNVETDVNIWTPQLEALYGLEPGGYPKTRDDFAQLIHPDDRASAFQSVEQAFATRLPTDGEWRTTWPDGTTHWIACRFQVFSDETGKPLKLTGVNLDMTERRRAEAAAVQQQRRLEGIVNSAMDGIITIDEDQHVILINAAAERMFLCRAAEVVGNSVERFLPSAIRTMHAKRVREFGQTGIAARTMGVFGAINGLRSDGTEFPIEASISQVEVDGRALFTVTCRDVTERVNAAEARRVLEAQLQQSQKMEAFGQLAGGVAHDFNNLLTIINGYSDMLHRAAVPPSDAHEMVGEIRSAGERAAALTRQMLAFSRRQVLSPQVLDLNTVITNIGKMLSRLIGEDVQLATVLRPAISNVQVDPGQIEQVIMNLAVNARDAMPRGGKLTIETSNVELDESYVGSHADVQPGSYVMLALTDTGSGMSPEVKAHLFEPFFTTKGPGNGTGLGLAVVHGIVKQSGGSIDVYSEVGVGTTLRIYLPTADTRVGDASAELQAKPPEGSETILLVEDESGVRGLAERLLRGWGYTLLTAHSGAAALELVASCREKIDLLVTDVVMPGMSGRQLAETLVAHDADLKVLFMSGYTDDAVVRHGVLQADVAFLQKPFSPDALARRVRDVLDHDRGRRSSRAAMASIEI